MTPRTFNLSCNGTLFASLDKYSHSITTAKATATSKVCCMVWLLYGYANVKSPQSPTTPQTAILKTWLFIHTDYANVKNQTFIHTDYANVKNQTQKIQKPP